MNIYTMHPDVNRFRWLMPREPAQAQALRLLWRSGTVVPDLPVKLNTVDETENLPGSDHPYVMSGVPVVSRSAKGVLNGILSSTGELVPMVHHDEWYYGIRLPLLRGAMDLERSDLTVFEGRIMRVRRHHFVPDLIREHPIFTVSEASSTAFVQEAVVTSVVCAGLTGFVFDLVWTG
jgi:hypothetical protein